MRCIIGCHSSIKDGILEGLKYTDHIDGNATQIFLGSPQSASLSGKKDISNEEISLINKWLKDNNHTLIIHTIYLLNFCKYSSDKSQIKFAQDNLIYDLEKTEELGGIGCVLHIGKKVDLSEEEAYKNMVDNVLFVLDKTKDSAKNTKLILETPAGTGSQIATTLEEFGNLWKMIPSNYKKRLGVCVDTAHIFSSGRDIRTPEGMINYFNDFDKLIGLKYLTCFHINDSKKELNSRKDMHEGIGNGYIFEKDKGGNLNALKELWKFASKNKVPMVFETHSAGFYDAPKDKGKLLQEIKLFRDWDSGKNPKFKLKDSFPIPPRKGKVVIETVSKQNKKNGGGNSESYLKFKSNTLIVKKFEILRDYYKVNDDKIRLSSYNKAIYQLKHYNKEITDGKQLENLDGIGDKFIKKINEILTTKTLKKIKDLDAIKVIASYKKQNKPHLDITNVLGFGEVRALQLYKEGIKTIPELMKAYKDKKIKVTKQQKIGLDYHNDLIKPIFRDESNNIKLKIAKLLHKEKEDHIKTLSVELVGSYPSGKETSKDIDILLTSQVEGMGNNITDIYSGEEIMKDVVKILIDTGLIIETLSLGKNRFMGLVRLDDSLPARHLDIFLTRHDRHMFSHFHYSSGVEFNKLVRDKAKRMGYKLNENGLYKNNEKVYVKNMRELFKLLDMKYVPEKDRY